MVVQDVMPKLFLHTDETCNENPSTEPGNTASGIVNLGEKEVEYFEWDSTSKSYIYIDAVRKTDIPMSQAKELSSESVFYDLAYLDLCVEELDVEEIKYTPRLAKEIKELLSNFEVREEIIEDHETILDMVNLPYDFLCQVFVKSSRQKAMQDLFIQMINNASSIDFNKLNTPANDEISTRVAFRKKVIRILNNYAISDRSSVHERQEMYDIIHSRQCPEVLLVTLIENRRGATIYKRIREQIINKFNSEERLKFDSKLSFGSFMSSINTIYAQGISVYYNDTMMQFLDKENIKTCEKEDEESRIACAKENSEAVRSYIKYMDFFDKEFTPKKQVVLERYEWIKEVYQLVQELYAGSPLARPAILDELKTAPELFDSGDGCRHLLENLLSIEGNVMKACRDYDNRMASLSEQKE